MNAMIANATQALLVRERRVRGRIALNRRAVIDGTPHETKAIIEEVEERLKPVRYHAGFLDKTI
tara:strand:- start:272 stop:463 length:192 start_codon:yes stop_codon:yes gene_type:complete